MCSDFIEINANPATGSHDNPGSDVDAPSNQTMKGRDPTADNGI